MAGRIEGKVALVTGGASGLGEAIARRFAAEGATVVIADIDADSGAALATDLGGEACFVRLDVTEEIEWLAAFATIEDRYGRLDVLVNNAGITTLGSIADLEVDAFRTMLEIDLIGVFLGCKHCIALMERTGGAVINMSSMAGLRAEPDLAGYNAAKAGVTLLTKSVALDYARRGKGMRCNSVHPGATHTPILDKVMAQSPDPKALYDGWVSGHPIGRLGKPEEIAALCLYLATDEAAFATQAPSLVLISALVNAAEHAASSSAAGSFAVSLCTFTPAIAASARSLAFAFNLASAMSARIESRVFSAAAFLSWAEVGDDGDDDGEGDDEGSAEHVVASPPGTVSPAGLVVP